MNSNNNQRNEISKNALEFVESKFDWESLTKKYEKCYRDVLQSKMRKMPS